MKKFAFIFFFIIILVVLIITMSKCITTIKEFYTFDTTEISTTTVKEEEEDDLEYFSSLQVEDFTVEIKTGEIAFDENDESIVFRNANNNGYASFIFHGAVVKEMYISEIYDYIFENGASKINVPLVWNGMEVNQVRIIVESDECDEIEMLLKRS